MFIVTLINEMCEYKSIKDCEVLLFITTLLNETCTSTNKILSILKYHIWIFVQTTSCPLTFVKIIYDTLIRSFQNMVKD